MPTEDNRFIFPMVPKPVPTRVQQPETGQSTVQFVYRNGDNFVMMDDVTYELIELTEAQVGPPCKFLKEGTEGITLTYLAGFLLGVEIPPIVELQVMQVLILVEETVDIGTSVAVLDSGAEVRVPATIKVGQIVSIDTKTGFFAGLAGARDAKEKDE